MTQGKVAHIISHTHWDREWYMPFEKHRVRLVQLMDTLLDVLEREPEFRSFHLDGQTIILDDYLQIRPEKRVQLEKFIREGRIHIGPWYILQDAFLTSSEANVRNLLIGHREAHQYGAVAKVGYFPDTFGNLGQAPQLMRQAGIDNAVFGRGVKPTGFNSAVADSPYESTFSELIWEAPDGSRVLGILFANWYSNGNEIPADEREAKTYWERKLADAEKYASTGELLFMNGCDHQPLQTDLPEAIRTARRLFPDVAFVHSNFHDYLEALKRRLPERLSVVKGELRSQRTDGWGTLVNTASSRVYLKKMNQIGQTLLEKAAEPLASLAAVYGMPYPRHWFDYAWKTLMQNHPHDSICGCSVDDVHREMVIRFDKSRQVTETIVEDAKRFLAARVDTEGFARFGEDALPFVVFNTSGWERGGTVTVELDAARLYEYRDRLSREEMIARLKQLDVSGRMVVDDEGRPVAADVEDLGVRFGYDLPDDRFRQPYWARRLRVTFAAAVPALGLRTYALVRNPSSGQRPEDASLVTGDRTMENARIRVDIADDGSLQVTDKTSGKVYRDLCVYEDTGDIGNEYVYRQPDGEEPLTTKGLPARIRLVEDAPYRAAFEIVHEWSVPASADGRLEEEIREFVPFRERKARRSERTVPLVIRTMVRLERDGKGVQIEISFHNQAKDHRLRALFPTDFATDVHRADSVFEVAERSNVPAPEWTNPSNCQHQQAFVDVSDETGGLTVANRGLNEYEILRDGRNTIAVTLLRAVAEMGDWGVFPTPEAQCLGEHTACLEIIPHAGNGMESGAFAEAYQFQIPWTVCRTDVHRGVIPPCWAPVQWRGEGLAFSAMKQAEDSDDWILRWFNMDRRESSLELKLNLPGSVELYKSDILERQGERLPEPDRDGRATLPVRACEIVTVGIRHRRQG